MQKVLMTLGLIALIILGCSDKNTKSESSGGTNGTAGSSGQAGDDSRSQKSGSGGLGGIDESRSEEEEQNQKESSNESESTDCVDGGTNCPDTTPSDKDADIEIEDGSADVDELETCITHHRAENTVLIEETAINQRLSIYMMLDVSGSMNEGNRWLEASNAITEFVEDPASASLHIGMQTFPLESDMTRMIEAIIANPLDSTLWFSDCNTCPGYEIPALPMATLPDNAAEITGWLEGQLPAGAGTPLECGLRGIATFCTQYAEQHSAQKCFGMLVTDGFPTGCGIDPPLLASIAHDAGVKIYTIGLEGADFALLDLIAEESGTDCTPDDPKTFACNVTQNMTLQEAMNAIREAEKGEIDVVTETILECEWEIPTPTDKEFDRNKVNVELTEPNGSLVVIKKMPNGDSDCEIYHEGWYYTDEDDPTPGQDHIKVCETTCEKIKRMQGEQIDIVLGCYLMPEL